MSGRRWSGVVAAVLVLAATAPPALGATTASVSLTRGAPVRECVDAGPAGRRCGVFGARRATVSWQLVCPSGAASEAWVRLRRMAGPAPAATDPVLAELAAQAGAGSSQVTVPPGFSVYATAGVRCPVPLHGPDGEVLEVQTESAENATPVLTTAPALVAFMVIENQVCGRPDLSAAQMRRVLQARSKGGTVVWILRFATARALSELQDDPLVPPFAVGQIGAADLPRIRLHARGAGLDLTRAPSRALFARARLPGMVKVRPRRSGTLRLWATVDGQATNRVGVRVLPPYRGGCPFA